jgi:hypothetical protein
LKKSATDGDSGDSEPAAAGGVVGIGEAARRDPLACPERALERDRRELFGVKDPAPRLNSTVVGSASIGEPGGDGKDMSKPSGPDGTEVWSPRSPSPSSAEGYKSSRSAKGLLALVASAPATRVLERRDTTMAARQGSRERKSRDLPRPAVPPRIAAPSRNSETGGTTCRWRPSSTPQFCYHPPRRASSLVRVCARHCRDEKRHEDVNGRGALFPRHRLSGDAKNW